MRVPHATDSAALVRHELSADLALHGVPAECIDEVVLVASELIGNAVRHTMAVDGLGLAVEWSVDPDGVTVQVSDPSAVRTEQQGRLPSRTVYEITDEGQRELRALRSEAFEEIVFRPDPVDLALATSTETDENVLRGFLEDRVRSLTAQLSRLDHQPDRRWPDQTVADDLVVEHARLRLRAELDWHALVLDRLGKLAEPSEG